MDTDQTWTGFEPPHGSVPWSCAWCQGQVFWLGMLDRVPALQCISCRKALPLDDGLNPSRWLDKTAWLPHVL